MKSFIFLKLFIFKNLLLRMLNVTKSQTMDQQLKSKAGDHGSRSAALLLLTTFTPALFMLYFTTY